MTKYYYAAQYPCGIATHSGTGRLYRNFYRFAMRAERDAWVEAGNPYRTQAGHRQVVSSRDADLRAALASGYAEFDVPVVT